MYVTREMLLAKLPPVRDEWVVIKDDQRVKDIRNELNDAYPTFAADYDRIYQFFEGATLRETCDNLFDFLKQQVQYVEEPEGCQTSALPGGILTRGFCDCKGYASFCAGVLGAIGRATGQAIDWAFCFASYREKQKTPYHVFVIVDDGGHQIWIDPTPGASTMYPKHAYLERPQEPVSVVDSAGELSYRAVAGVVGAVAPDPAAAAALSIATQISNTINKGNVRGTYFGDWLSDFARPTQAWNDLMHFLGGYKYTNGDYALGEIFMNRVLNESTYNRLDTPDGLIPLAWAYFTQLFGIPIAVNTDFDTINTGSLSAYLEGRPEQAGYVTQEQVTRAYNLLQELGHDDKMIQWPPADFGLMPYVAPIPDPRVPGRLYSGVLPNGQTIQDGVAITAATSGSNIQMPGGAPAAGGVSVTTVLLLAAAAGVVLWLVLDE